MLKYLAINFVHFCSLTDRQTPSLTHKNISTLVTYRIVLQTAFRFKQKWVNFMIFTLTFAENSLYFNVRREFSV